MSAANSTKKRQNEGNKIIGCLKGWADNLKHTHPDSFIEIKTILTSTAKKKSTYKIILYRESVQNYMKRELISIKRSIRVKFILSHACK